MSTPFEDFLAAYSPEVRDLAREARALIFDVVPDISEHVYPAMKVVRYGLEGKRLAGIAYYLAPLKAGLNLGFYHGTSLPDAEKLLEGTGKNLRHVKLRKPEDIKNPAVRALVEAELAEARRAR